MFVTRYNAKKRYAEFVPVDADRAQCTVCMQPKITAYAVCAGVIVDFASPILEPEIVMPNDFRGCDSCTRLMEQRDIFALVQRRLEGLPEGNPHLGALPAGMAREEFVQKEFELVARSLEGRSLTYVDDPHPDFRFNYVADFMPGSLPVKSASNGRDPDCHRWLEKYQGVSLADFEQMKETFRKTYSYAIPGKSAIDAIKRHSPNGVVDIGAGNGYWRYLLENAGVSVRAIDKYPVMMGRNPYWQRVSPELRNHWAGIEVDDESALRNVTDETLLLVWPPDDDDFALKAARIYRGKKLCYIGQWRSGTADKAFHNLLRIEWRLVEAVRIPTFYSFFDQLMIFERRPRADVEADMREYLRRQGKTPAF